MADIVRAPAETVRYWRATRRGPKGTKVGRRILYADADVRRWLDSLSESA